MPLPFPAAPDYYSADLGTVSLLTTESGGQLYVAGFGLSLGKKEERLVIRQKRKVVAHVPLFRVQEVILGSRGISLSSDIVEELCARGVRIAFLSSGGRPFALLTTPLLTATVETRRMQFAARDSEAGVEIARALVAGKLRNQEKLLLYFARSRMGEIGVKLKAAAIQIRGLRRQAVELTAGNVEEARGPLMGYEGTAGRIYWQQLAALLPPQLGFRSREHRGPSNAVNAALNYGYGILYGHVWGAVMNAGLEPFAGFLHTDRSGKPSLILDLVEEFRQPVVDRAVLSWLLKGGSLSLKEDLLDGMSREEVASRVLLRLNATEQHKGKEHQVRSIIQMQARLLASSVRGNARFRPYTFRW
ncbi:MAG: CRISPR-associated endonuclease Cas1 [Bryobacterales bacterium]|nr:CRISPR-associated endonuclease Cas1 [Bryobacterales bacterium]